MNDLGKALREAENKYGSSHVVWLRCNACNATTWVWDHSTYMPTCGVCGLGYFVADITAKIDEADKESCLLAASQERLQAAKARFIKALQVLGPEVGA